MVEKRSDEERSGGARRLLPWRRWRWLNFPVVEQRAPASGCRDHASRLREFRGGKRSDGEGVARGSGRRPGGGSAVVEKGAQRPSRTPTVPTRTTFGSPYFYGQSRRIPHLIRTPVRLEWDHDPRSRHQPRHRSGHRCRCARVRPGPACRGRCRRGRPASCRLFVGGPASGGVDRGRGPVRRHPGPGRCRRQPGG